MFVKAIIKISGIVLDKMSLTAMVAVILANGLNRIKVACLYQRQLEQSYSFCKQCA